MKNVDAVPTVKIAVPVTKGNPDGFTEINASDFNAKIHKLFSEGKIEVKKVVAEIVKIEKEAVAEVEKVTGWGTQ
jgi:ribosomal protein L15